ncbi:MAG: glutamine synthetase type III, partial [Clostridia bacterium]
MEIMKKVAARHDMVCLLHEKPFEGVNGSGKHNNWSIRTNTGHNIFEPGNSPQDNAQFLLVLSAMIAAVDENQDLLRISVASAGNDHRLGAAEAPPAIVSMFLGDELTGILQAIADGRTYSKRAKCNVEIGVQVLPKFAMDSTDRNRTSPLAFTGNKFEFRMPGSAFSIAGINMVLNTIVADQFEKFAARLQSAEDFNTEIENIIRDVMKVHGKIIFNGNNYAGAWLKEADKRGLLNLPTTIDALPLFNTEKNVALFGNQKVLSSVEIKSRQEILIENYCKLINIEASTTHYMATKYIIPAVMEYKCELAETANAISKANSITGYTATAISPSVEISKLKKLNDLTVEADNACNKLHIAIEKAHSLGFDIEAGKYYGKEVISAMNAVRKACDEMEIFTAKKYWPFPTYGDILFSVN